MTDRTQNVLIPLPCPFCGGEPKMIDVGEVILHPIAEIVCSVPGSHAAAAYGRTMTEALSNWNQRAAPASPAAADLERFRLAWNNNRGPLPKVTKLTGDRVQKLQSRIKEGLTFDDFQRAAWVCSHTQFLLHGNPPDKPFQATFDWLLGNSGTITKVLDGNYGETGRTAEEIKAERDAEERKKQQMWEETYRIKSEGMKAGIWCSEVFQPVVFKWELRNSETEAEVYDRWVSYQANGMVVQSSVRRWLDDWITKRKTQSELTVESMKAYVESRKNGVMEADEWALILGVLKKKINPHSFDTWLKPTRVDHRNGRSLFVRIPSDDFQHVGDRYADLINGAIKELALDLDKVQFVTEVTTTATETSGE